MNWSSFTDFTEQTVIYNVTNEGEKKGDATRDSNE